MSIHNSGPGKNIDHYPIWHVSHLSCGFSFRFSGLFATILPIQNAVPSKSLKDKTLPLKALCCPIGTACQQIVPEEFKKRKHSRLIIMYKVVNYHTAIPLPDYIRPRARVTRSQQQHRFTRLSSTSDLYKISSFPRTLKDWDGPPQHIIELPILEQLKEAAIITAGQHRLACVNTLHLHLPSIVSSTLVQMLIALTRISEEVEENNKESNNTFPVYAKFCLNWLRLNCQTASDYSEHHFSLLKGLIFLHSFIVINPVMFTIFSL